MTDDTKRTENVRRTMLVFDNLKAQRDQEIVDRELVAASDTPEPASVEPPVVLRVRGAMTRRGKPTVNLKKADKSCEYCGGTGRREDRRIHDEKTDEYIVIPVVCRCVKRNGGVAKDLLEKLASRELKKLRWGERRDERRKLARKAKRKKRRRKPCRTNRSAHLSTSTQPTDRLVH